MKKISLFSSLLLLAACSTGIPIEKYNAHPASPEKFTICYGYSCTSKAQTGFTKAEWKKITGTVKGAKTPEAERSKIAKAIALMETYTGEKTGTYRDLKEAVSSKQDRYQLDCIDETVNTTQYLKMLHKEALLKFHEPDLPTHRGYLIDGKWPHNTAVMRERETGRQFVVDSFYRANGEEPYIVPRADWLAGWRPPGATQ